MTEVHQSTVLPLALPHRMATSAPPVPPAPAAQPALALPGRMLPGFTSNLLVQANDTESAATASVIAHAGVGVVHTLSHRHRRRSSQFADVLAAVTHTRRVAPTADVLVDRNRYSGGRRADTTSPMSAQWVEDQLIRLKLPWAMGDPGFASSIADVGSVLSDGQTLKGRVIIPLPIPHELLRDDADTILGLVNDQDKPVAIILQHRADPFGTAGVVEGLTHLLHGADVPVLLLRTDTSALGAISHGAAAAAVGAHSGLRHVFPIQDKAGGAGEKLAFVIPELLTYVLANRFAKAYLLDPSLPMWRCACWLCGGRDLNWIKASQHAPIAAFQHSVTTISQLGAQLQRLSRTHPIAAWDQMVTAAQAAHGAASNPSGSPWAPQDFLAHWHQGNSRVSVT